MKALVVKAPHAPLQALGVYEFETRGFAPRTTLNPGDHLAIVLGRKVKPYIERPEAWDRLAASLAATREGVCAADGNGPWTAHWFRRGYDLAYPLGAVIAVVTYDSALPVVADLAWDDEGGVGIAGAALSTEDGGLYLHNGDAFGVGGCDMDDQIPLGDFTPGRYGWLLSNPHRLTNPVPCPAVRPDGTRTVMQGVFTLPDDVHEAVAAQLP